MKNANRIVIKTEYIKLDQFLKYCGIVELGSYAKPMILSGKIKVNNEIETRRGRKLVNGDRIEVKGEEYIISDQV